MGQGFTVSEEGFQFRKEASVCWRHCSHILASAELGLGVAEHKRQAQQRPLQVGKAKSALIVS